MKNSRSSVLIAMLALSIGVAQAQTAEISATVTDEQGVPVADAVVVAMPADGSARPPAKAGERPRAGVVDQVDKEFTPKVTAVLVGTAVTFPNHDDVRHQVYSFSPAKRFELPLYAGVPAGPVVFDKPGVVTIGCNIHDWMVGYIYVSESPFFAMSDTEGTALLTGLPAGRYTVRVWHARMRLPEQTTSRPANLEVAQNAALDWQIARKSELRVRRAPAAGQGGRY